MTSNIIDFFFGVIISVVKSPYMNFVSIGISWVACNRLSIGRDKRSEFNTVIEPIRNKFIKFKNDAIYIDIPEHDIIDIKNGFWFWNSIRFDRAIRKYKKTISKENQKSDGMGGFSYIDESKIIHAKNNILKFLNKK